MDTLFGSVLEYYKFDLNLTPFQTLNSKGINIISDDSLRLEIITVYEVWNRRLTFINNSEQKLNEELLRPYYLNDFRNVNWSMNKIAIPKKFEEVLKDDYYVNILEYKLSLKIRNQRMWNSAQAQMMKLKERIDKHFGEN